MATTHTTPAAARTPARPAVRPHAASPTDGALLACRHRPLLTFGVMLATIIQILDTTIANVALPHMQTALGASTDTVTWVLTSYLVASAIAIPITGWVSDRVGSRNLFLWAIVGFVVSSALCGAAQSLGQMVVFRALQGISAAFMNPLSQTVLLDINPPEKQAKAMSIWGMGIMAAPILGPVIGGFLTENFSWRWVFYVNLPLGAICLAILWWLLPSRTVTHRRFDLAGFALLATAITALQLMLDRGQGQDWLGSTEIVIYLVLAVSAAWMFVVHMATTARPMFERALFADRNLATGLCFLLVMNMIMMSTMALLPNMLQTMYGHSVMETGEILMPRGTGVLLTTALCGRLLSRGVDPRWLVGAGFSLATLATWQMTTWAPDMGTGPVLVGGLMQGLGMGLAFTPLNMLAFATLPGRFRTEAASLMNLSRSIGSSIGISVVTTLLARSIQTAHSELVPDISALRLGVDPGWLAGLGDTGKAALAIVDGEINRQALMIAYLNDFFMMGIIGTLSLPLTLLMRKPARNAARPDAAEAAAAAGH